MSNDDFQDRMFLASEAVYEQIEQGQPVDVPAALMDAQVQASDDSY
ncbi:hypothetical protein KYY02_19375 [Streptomyces pimonensis]|uniref:Uncharacterized protein n=1 Tax=Streptomyces pimonensis TaxID=2860288 RepID=A0ABV4J1L9_9ACTN